MKKLGITRTVLRKSKTSGSYDVDDRVGESAHAGLPDRDVMVH
jgi:hypothetical protein